MISSSASQRGVSLIEAVVAMAIMGFGMLGVLGMQSALRSNADISKQRSEAVRIAQATIESRRAFSVLAPASGAASYDAVVTTASTDVVPDNSNSTYTLTTTVTPFPAVGDELTVAQHKRIVVDVTWRDRNSDALATPQSVRMGTIISALAPEVAAALSTPGDGSPAQTPGGRHPAIPHGAVDLGNGTSRFAPPGAPTGTTWTFNNVTGFITQKCVITVCTDFPGRLLQGFVNFASGTSPSLPAPRPTSADAESPPAVFLIGTGGELVTVSVPITAPTVDTVPCFHRVASTFIEYFCAMPVTLVAPQHWTGQAQVNLPTGRDLAGSISDDNDNKYRVCRYTTVRAQSVVPPLPYTSSTVFPIRNENHPLNYVQVTTSLVAQNFLVIRAGNGSLTPRVFDCPADDTGTPEINGTTWHHQPSS